MFTHGPVFSNRLGLSIGVQNTQAKYCSYSCTYCQLGVKVSNTILRQKFYNPKDLVREIEEKLNIHRGLGGEVDYVAFVPDGEPTLDLNLAKVSEMVKKFGVKIAITTNASLLDDKDVWSALMHFDLVSIKVDAVYFDLWKKLNAPFPSMNFAQILNTIKLFSKEYRGKLVTESMLVSRVNDGEAHLFDLANFIGNLKPAVAYLSTPTRHPADSDIRPVTNSILYYTRRVFKEKIPKVEILMGYEDHRFVLSGNLENDLLNFISAQPMRREDILEFLYRAKADSSFLDGLIDDGKLVASPSRSGDYFMRKDQQQ
ncbi:MAG: radical SAM protein [Bacteroidales bacterium]|nr:radical SAM protein [Bacteroidales bacterium]